MNFNETKHMSFLIKDDQLIKKYNKKWNKTIKGIKKDLIAN